MLIALLARMATASDHSARRLYHTIIVAGAALVSGAACSDDGESKQRYSQQANGGKTKAAGESDGAAGAEAEGANDTSTTGVASPWW